MVYKKYIKRGGKLYGPYEYQSYRDESGRVKTQYLKKAEQSEQKKSFNKLYLLLVLLGLVVLIYLLQFQFTGKSIFLEKSTFFINEPITGNVSFSFVEGEFYPENSLVKVLFNNETREFTLKEIILFARSNINESESDFYVENFPEINGSGKGYGFFGAKDIPADVFFEFIVLKDTGKLENKSGEEELHEEEQNQSFGVGDELNQSDEQNVSLGVGGELKQEGNGSVIETPTQVP